MKMRSERIHGSVAFSRGESSKSLPKALADHGAGIRTIGDLVDHQTKHGDFWAREIRSLGKGGAEQLADALDRYWRDHPQAKASSASDDAIPLDEAMGASAKKRSRKLKKGKR